MRTGKYLFCLTVLALTTAMAPGGQKLRPEFQPVTDDPNLPRVLILGDSISIGYTLPLRAALKGIANLHRPPENCASTKQGLAKIDKWLGTGKWDVIHFNWGLHDLKHINKDGKMVPPDQGKRQVPPEQYAKNLEMLVERLEKTGAILIWRPTTPVPQGAYGRVPGDENLYNQIALRIMKRHGIQVDDLNPFILSKPVPHTKPDNVHFTKEGSQMLAGRIAATIKKALAERAGGK